MGKSSAPPIDYAAQAQAQAAANKDSAQYNNNANRVDQITPLGSSTWALKPGADPQNPKPGDYVQTIALSPEQQGLYSSGLAGSQTLATGLAQGAQRAVDSLGRPVDTSGLPPLQGAPGIVQTAQPGAGIQGSLAPAGALQNSIDTSGNAALTNDFSADRDKVVSALMSRIAPDQAFAREQLNTSLANKGIDLGSTAYQRANDLQGRQENDARMGAILAGGQEQSRLQGLALQTNNQQFNQGLAGANLANAAQGTQFQQGLASANFGNTAQAQQFGQQASIDSVINSLLGRNATFGNEARAQGISEDAYLRSLPLNEYNALKGGTAVQQPTFGNFYTANAGAAPVFDAAVAQGNANTAQNAQNQSGTNAAIGSVAGLLGTAALFAF